MQRITFFIILLLLVRFKTGSIFTEVNNCVNITHAVKSLAQLTIKDIARIVRGLILQELPGEVSSSVKISLTLEIP